jgi:hypothetical protein
MRRRITWFVVLSAVLSLLLPLVNPAGIVLAASDAATVPVSATLGEAMFFTVHDPVYFELLPSPWDTRTSVGNLEVATNAEEGYTISVAIDHQLTEENDDVPDVISAWSGTVDQPVAWPETAAGFGFSLDDGATYAGFPTEETIVLTGDQTNGRTFPILYRVTADSNLDAGLYSATVTYTAVARF